MSLDVYLEVDQPHDETPREVILIRRDGATAEITRAEWDAMHPGREPVVATITPNPGEPHTVYQRNITHNLNTMAGAAGIYKHLWRPDEIEISRAWQLVQPLEDGLKRLRAEPDKYRLHNPSNGWGTYEGLVDFVESYLTACREHPDAKVRVWR